MRVICVSVFGFFKKKGGRVTIEVSFSRQSAPAHLDGVNIDQQMASLYTPRDLWVNRLEW